MRAADRNSSLPPGAGRRERRKQGTRKELLASGRRLFSKKGLYDCRVEEITERADLGKGTLYQYFASKEDLVFAVVEQGFSELALATARSTADATRFEDIVAAIVTSHLEFFRENPDLLKIFHQVRGVLKFDRAEWRPLRRILDDHLEQLAREMKRGAPERGLRGARGRELAVLIFGGVSGWLSVRMAMDPRNPAIDAPPGLVDALVAAASRFGSRGSDRAFPRPFHRRAGGGGTPGSRGDLS